VGQVVLQVAAATPCKCSLGIEKSFWPALYAKVNYSQVKSDVVVSDLFHQVELLSPLA